MMWLSLSRIRGSGSTLTHNKESEGRQLPIREIIVYGCGSSRLESVAEVGVDVVEFPEFVVDGTGMYAIYVRPTM